MVTIDPETNERTRRIIEALSHEAAAVRMRAAVAAGTHPDPDLLEPLMDRCVAEDDPGVRDTLSWALARLPKELVLPRVRRELYSADETARSQAVHTLTKIADPATWPWITRDLIADPDDRVARTAWRAAVTLVPHGEEDDLARALVAQLGRGDHEVRLALTRALVNLGDAAVEPVDAAGEHADFDVAAHARATVFFRHDPRIGFDGALEKAKFTLLVGRSAPWRPEPDHSA